MNRAPVDELLEQGKSALVALKYREQVAIYRAASISLQAAIKSAENGRPDSLNDWLRDHFSLLSYDTECGGVVDPIAVDRRVMDLHLVEDSVREKEYPTTELNCEEDPWASMEIAAQDRLQATSVEATSVEATSVEATSVSTPIVNAPIVDQPSMPSEEVPSLSEKAIDTGGCDFGGIDQEISQDDSTVVLESPLPEQSEAIEIDESKTAELAGAMPTTSCRWNWREWMAPPVWASVGVHSLAIGVLSLFVIRQMNDPSATSIVSATFDGESILTQTPMETLGPVTAENLAQVNPTSEILEPVSLENLSSAGLIGNPMGQVTSPGIEGVALAGGLAQGLSSESLSRVTQAQAVSTGGSRQVSGAEFYGVKATGNLFVYVVDCSPSMRRENAFEAAKFEIARSLQSMKSSQRYFIYFFAKEIERMESEVGVEEDSPLYATPENVKRTMQWLERTRIQREGRPPNDVLTEAILLEPDGIFLLFDGDTRVDVAKHLTEVNRGADLLQPESTKAPIHVVHFFAEEFAGRMRQVASENQGTYRFIPKTASFTPRNGR